MGDTVSARRTLTALVTLLEGQPERKELHDLAQQMLKDLREARTDQPDRFALLESALQRADQLAASQPDEAERIWRSVLELYGPDPDAQPYVRNAREALSALEGARD